MERWKESKVVLRQTLTCDVDGGIANWETFVRHKNRSKCPFLRQHSHVLFSQTQQTASQAKCRAGLAVRYLSFAIYD